MLWRGDNGVNRFCSICVWQQVAISYMVILLLLPLGSSKRKERWRLYLAAFIMCSIDSGSILVRNLVIYWTSSHFNAFIGSHRTLYICYCRFNSISLYIYIQLSIKLL